MTRRRVFYDRWQYECCGAPFAVGDQVSWDVHEAPYLDELGPDILHDEHHASGHETFPITGVVRRIQIVRARQDGGDGGGSRTFRDARLRDVREAADEWAGERNGDELWLDDGMLVDLDV